MRTFLIYAHSLFQTPGVVDASEGEFGMDVLGLVARSSLPSLVVLFILILFSVVSNSELSLRQT